MGLVLTRLCSRHNGWRRYSGVTCTHTHRCKLLVVGGGTGGCSVAWRFSRMLKDNEIIVLEPSKYHYYQPLFALVAAGMKKLGDSRKPLEMVLPRNVTWFRDYAEHFDPCNSTVYTRCGDKIFYEYMVVAMGLQNEFEQMPGLQQALDDPNSGVSTIYSKYYCHKTWCSISQFRGGHAVFTFPTHGAKCAGAAQKIMYLADDYWRRHKLRSLSNVTYTTGAGAIFGVPKYAKALTEVARDRGIAVNYNTELVEVTPREAVFAVGKETIVLPYNLLHVTPPMCPPACLRGCECLVSSEGYLDVDLHSLQHRRYTNVYGLGDCTCTPNSKSVAAISKQSYVLEQNLTSTMQGKEPKAKYNGYGACPMLTSYRRGILAEFMYDKKLCETFPFDQSKERRLFYHLKKDILPYFYWNKIIKGQWNGPAKLRKILNPLGRWNQKSE